MYLIDTDVLSALRRQDKADPRFADWVMATQPQDMYLSTLSVYEVKVGALRIARRDPVQGQDLHRWIHHFVLRAFTGRILPIDAGVALRCAALHVPDPRPVIDSLIAATALEHGLTVATRNIADFLPLGVPVLNPWQAEGRP
ncbi:type II toxin-antitoxin system VapC family toxin [Labrys monachus]|uniref:Nucleic acid-binding protein n=1 Tax=Labrys monachus TaxID=217067 RepID=A0ABU0FI39_9HYPH|nr:type II toxin-antitoxin system VapC family toxin [Labrys monachus]MDQ0394273.1 putative nucleic acid-binding protein [Labrys monachus]